VIEYWQGQGEAPALQAGGVKSHHRCLVGCQRGGIGKERGDVAIGAEPEQDQIEDGHVVAIVW
jgi:hypothetical protein